jgi:carboxypeptidase T
MLLPRFSVSSSKAVGFFSAIAIGKILFSAGLALAHANHAPAGDGESRILTLQLKDFKNDMRKIVEAGYDIAGVNPARNEVDIVQRSGSRQPFTTDILDAVVATKAINPALAPDEGYKTPGEVDFLVQSLADRYPDLVTVESFGRTHEGRDLWAVKITSAESSRYGKPVIFLNALHHAREVMTVEVVLDAAETLAAGYSRDAQIKQWLDTTEVWIVPMVNPDGSNKVWTADNMWRKNTSGSDGVDVNRNYPHRWNECNGSSGSPYSDTYRGPSAGSENETQAIMSLVEKIRPVYSISFHSYSELVLYPYSCDGERVPQREVVEGGGKEMAKLLPKDGSSGTYTPGTSWEILYAVDGGDIDWMYNKFNVIPYVIELNSTSQGFQPAYGNWRDKTVQKVRAAWQYLIRRVHQSGVRGKVESVGGLTVSEAVVHVTSMTKQSDVGQMFPVRPDGTFHAVLTPGSYKISVAIGDQVTEKEILVGADLVNVDLQL